MFGRKKKNGIEVTKLSSLIADNLHIVGDVHFTGGLRIDGRVEGNVFGKPGTKGLLVLSEKGIITGKVQAYDAVINGNITGDVDVEHFAELQVSANVVGNVRYRQLQLDCGATVEGKLVRIHDDAPDRQQPERQPERPATVTPPPVAAAPQRPVTPPASAVRTEPPPVTSRPPATATPAPRSESVASSSVADKDKLATPR